MMKINQKLTLSRLKNEDLNSLIRFLQRQFRYSSNLPFYKNLRLHFIEVINNPTLHHYFLLKNNSNHIVGGIGLTFVNNKNKKHLWWIDCFALSPRIRGKGIGKKLFTLIEKKVLELRIPHLNIYTSTSEKEITANILYAKFHYKIIAKFKEKEADGTMVYGLFRYKKLV